MSQFPPAACLALGQGSILFGEAKATDRCLSSHTAFIKASAGCEYRGGLCLYPPAAIKTSQVPGMRVSGLKHCSGITGLTPLHNSQLWVLNHPIRAIHHCYLYHPCED
ncbi:hypothetical protein PBY51_013687 [Eleginops maclovinus]|uniref:Uncharacterized protein n=1 Tax=Eleginops maclovinus TaxID=56733 RepID=A0AAN8AS11_ELEMC|nr:hypothetical protein PBY51_013687 [Eleginops maclovinus]